MDDSDIINAVGVSELTRRLAERTGHQIDREAIYKWRERGRIAFRWRPWVLIVAREAGVTVPEELPPLPVTGRCNAA